MPKEITDSLVEEIVDEILKTEKIVEGDGVKSDDVSRLKNRISNLENRLEKFISNFKTVVVEVDRQLTEKWEELNKGEEKRVLSLQGQIEDLRTALIRLSNELKSIREVIGQK